MLSGIHLLRLRKTKWVKKKKKCLKQKRRQVNCLKVLYIFVYIYAYILLLLFKTHYFTLPIIIIPNLSTEKYLILFLNGKKKTFPIIASFELR